MARTELNTGTCTSRWNPTGRHYWSPNNRCGGCGEAKYLPVATEVAVPEPVEAEVVNETFEHLLDLEFDVRSAEASVVFAPMGLPLYLKDARYKELDKAKAALSAAVDALTPEEGAAYGPYRARVLAELKARRD